MPTLFDLYATLGLDTTDFKEQADAAVQEGQSVAGQVADAFEEVDLAAEEADKALDEVETKSGTTEAVMNGLAQATEQVVSKALESLIDLGKESLEIASQSGTALAEEYLRAQERLGVSSEALKMKIGNTLLPVATIFSNFASDMMGITDSDRLLIMLDQIDSYSFKNIQTLSASLDSVFGRFEQVEYGEGMNVEDMTAALDSQIEYWNQYNRTLSALQQRGVNASFLSSIADGTIRSFETLQALEQADAAQLETIMQSFETLESVKESTVSSLNEMQLYVDEDYRAMVQSVGELVAGMDQSEAAYANGLLTGDAVAGGLAAAYPNIVSLVDAINGTLAQIGNVQIRPIEIPGASGIGALGSGGNAGRRFASGINYVPFDDYDATLHRGEAVLPRQEAEAYRQSRTSDNADVVAKLDDVIDALTHLSLNMDGQKVADLITGRTSRNISRETNNKRRYSP